MRHPITLPHEPSASSVRIGPRTVEYRLRRSPRSRGLRVTIDARDGLVVSVPLETRRGWAHPEPRIEAFLRDRQAWVLRHLDALTRERDEARARGGARDGGQVPYRGELHRVRVVPGAAGVRRSTVERAGADEGDELIVRLAARERRSVERVLEAWLRERAAEAIDRAIAAHAEALRVVPTKVDLRDPRSRWGSASKHGRLMFSWRLVLAPPDSLETVVVHELAHLRVFGHGPGFWALVAGRRPSHLADRAWLRRNSHAVHAALEVSPGFTGSGPLPRHAAT
jgi:predicted metal-dependent hydrolase